LDEGTLDLCRRLGLVAVADRSYVIAITRDETPAGLRAAIEAGVDDYVSSPLSMAALQIKLALGERNLARRRRRQAEVRRATARPEPVADPSEVEGLRRREEYFRSLLESSSDLVSILDIDGQILYQSPSSQRLLAQPSERMMGANVFEYIHADDRALVHGALHEVMLEAGAKGSVQARFRHGDDTWVYLESVLENLIDNPVLGGVLMSSRDVAQRRKVASALKRERAFFRQLFDNSPAGIVILDNQDRVVDANRSWVDLFQFTVDEIAGKPLSDFFVSDTLRAEAVELSRLVTERQTVDIETVRRRKDGSDVDVSILGFPIELADQRIGAYGIYNDITERKNAERKLFHGAFHDALTGLPNRSLLEERLERSLRRSQRRDDYEFALVFIDLDGFKQINDTLGHAAGDELLIEMARRLEGCLRPGDTVARLGGDEFNILLDDFHEVADATRVADRILASLAEPFDIAGQEVTSCTGSIGIAFSTAGYDTVDDLMRDADLAMYRAKSRGKARYELVDGALQQEATDRLDQEQALIQALDADQFELVYQPLYALGDRRIVGFEALGRWRHPERGVIAAADWLPTLRAIGGIVRYGRWVLDTALRQLGEWTRRFPEHDGALVSINLSAEELGDPELLDHLDARRDEHGVHPAAIALEVSEQVIPQGEIGDILWSLRQRGHRVTIDDFGTAASSIPTLQELPIDTVKIDSTFVRSMGPGGAEQEIVRALTALGDSLG
ncbi:MAG: diguanylate cyclase, partial [Acidobacteriota bacterium]